LCGSILDLRKKNLVLATQICGGREQERQDHAADAQGWGRQAEQAGPRQAGQWHSAAGAARRR